MNGPQDCIVVGGGLVGVASARALARAGRRVLLLEPGGKPGAASGAAAGMLAPQVEARAGDPMLPLALAARDHYPGLVRELEADGRTSTGYHRTGIALVALDDAQVVELKVQVEAQRALGLAAEWWDAAELKRRVPAIGPAVLGAQFAPDDGYLDSVALVGGLLAQARSDGAEIVREAALEIVVAGGRVTAVRTADTTYHAAVVVIAAGAWSPQLTGLPRPLPVEPVRGQIILVEAPPRWRGPILFGHGGYIVPRGGDALLGSTMERAGFDARTTEDGLRTIREATAAILPDLRDRPVRRTWAGLRPMAADMRPIIGEDPEVQGLFYATGHGRNGILLGPITGEIIRDLVVSGETHWDLAPYSVSRFAR